MAHLARLQQSSARGGWRRLPPQLLDGGVLPGYEREAQELHSEQCPKGPALLLLAGLRHRSPSPRRVKGLGGAAASRSAQLGRGEVHAAGLRALRSRENVEHVDEGAWSRQLVAERL